MKRASFSKIEHFILRIVTVILLLITASKLVIAELSSLLK